MTTLKTAAQQALKAWDGGDTEWFKRAYTVMEALRAALAEPVQTPHLFPLQSDPMRIDPVTGNVGIGTPSAEPVAWFYQNMYTEQEYLVWKKGTGGRNWRPLYTAPPQRKPLTEEEIRDLWSWAMTAEAERTATTQQHAFARAIERAHGIKE